MEEFQAIVVREKTAQPGRIPRIAKLVVLASQMQSMIESGQVEIFQQLAELGRISQPRMTQIMSLLLLAPDIQEELLYLPEVMHGKTPIHERLLRPLTTEIDWKVKGGCGKGLRDAFSPYSLVMRIDAHVFTQASNSFLPATCRVHALDHPQCDIGYSRLDYRLRLLDRAPTRQTSHPLGTSSESVPVLDPNLSAGIFRRCSIDKNRLLKGRLLSTSYAKC